MRDETSDRQSSDIDIVAEAACCTGGKCGPIFETSLIELVFQRVRLLAGGRNATPAVEVSADPMVDQLVSAASSVRPITARPQEDAPHD